MNYAVFMNVNVIFGVGCCLTFTRKIYVHGRIHACRIIIVCAYLLSILMDISLESLTHLINKLSA